MGDRFVRKGRAFGEGLVAFRAAHLRGKPPPEIISWGLGEVAKIGHNNGPPLDDDTPGYIWRRHRWTAVHAEVWKTPPLPVLKFRMARAEAAGLTYREYMLTLLDTGRFAQAKDHDRERTAAIDLIRATWTGVIARVAPESRRIARGVVLSSLLAAYDDDGRHYHNLVHIADMLRGLDRHGGDMAERDELILAILFHDAVYDATRGDNEAASARLARLHLGELGVGAGIVERIEALILATRHGTGEAGGDAAMALLLDLDLAVLATPAERYAAYAAGIRREYAHVLDDAFRAGRIKVLTSFLARPQIFLSPGLAVRWEVAARENLAGEIHDLGSFAD